MGCMLSNDSSVGLLRHDKSKKVFTNLIVSDRRRYLRDARRRYLNIRETVLPFHYNDFDVRRATAV